MLSLFLLILSWMTLPSYAGLPMEKIMENWKSYYAKNQENRQVRIEKTAKLLCQSSEVLPFFDDCKHDAELVNQFGVMAVIDSLDHPMSWRELSDLTRRKLEAFDADSFKTSQGKEWGQKNFQAMQAFYDQFSQENLEGDEQRGKELLKSYFPQDHEELLEIFVKGIQTDQPDIGHREDHYFRVIALTEFFMQKLLNGSELRVEEKHHQISLAFLAALFHDIRSVPKNASNADKEQASLKSKEAATQILNPRKNSLNLSDADIQVITAAIGSHSWSTTEKPQDLVGKAVLAADRMDASGVIGVYRTLAVGGGFPGTCFAHPEHPFDFSQREEGQLNDKTYTLDHFYTKIRYLISGKGDKDPIETDLQAWSYENKQKPLDAILDSLKNELR